MPLSRARTVPSRGERPSRYPFSFDRCPACLAAPLIPPSPFDPQPVCTAAPVVLMATQTAGMYSNNALSIPERRRILSDKQFLRDVLMTAVLPLGPKSQARKSPSGRQRPDFSPKKRQQRRLSAPRSFRREKEALSKFCLSRLFSKRRIVRTMSYGTRGRYMADISALCAPLE